MDTRSQPSGPGLPDQHAAVEQSLPDRVPVGEPAEQHEVRVASRRPSRPCSRSQSTVRSRSARSVSTLASSSSACRERGRRGRLGDRGQVVRQPHHPQRVADLRRRGEVAEPCPGERERLAHRAGDDQVAGASGSSSSALGGAGAAELRVGLVDHDDAAVLAARSSHSVPITSSGSAVPVGLFGEGSSTTSGRCSRDQRHGRGRGRTRSPRARRPATQSVIVSRAYSGYIEYVGANDDRRPPGPAERLQQLQHHLVGPVGRPHLLRRDRRAGLGGQVRGQVCAQRGELAVGVAVQRARRRRHRPRRCRRRSLADGG